MLQRHLANHFAKQATHSKESAKQPLLTVPEFRFPPTIYLKLNFTVSLTKAAKETSQHSSNTQRIHTPSNYSWFTGTDKHMGIFNNLKQKELSEEEKLEQFTSSFCWR